MQNEVVASTQVDGAALAGAHPRLLESPASDYGAWIEQAIKVRDKALRLADERVHWDERTAPTVAACDYLAESEKLFELTRKLVQTQSA